MVFVSLCAAVKDIGVIIDTGLSSEAHVDNVIKGSLLSSEK